MATVTYSQVQELLMQVPEERLPVAFEMLLGLADCREEVAEPRTDFLRLPLSERHQILAQQAEQLRAHYHETADERTEWQAGDFAQSTFSGARSGW
jgi:hypothetical protein